MFVWYYNVYAFRSNSDMGREIEIYEKCSLSARAIVVVYPGIVLSLGCFFS
jgi:hypothetical protein